MWCVAAWWFALLPHSTKVLSLTPQIGWGLYVWRFACSPCVYAASLQVLWFPPTVRRHAISLGRLLGDSKLSSSFNPRMKLIRGWMFFWVPNHELFFREKKIPMLSCPGTPPCKTAHRCVTTVGLLRLLKQPAPYDISQWLCRNC